ncbi:very-long-chain-(S)-2-hydroxy-acid oxidase [Aureococcus anophagefferens]|uniref:Very-long-chain-(S)-2-hydroxy-acid oxidase n=1 Tax=Aureococcus anophagefferens TaxID=44056 RepID=A0ABR1FX42_AURAN
MSGLRTITFDEVAKHNTKEDCWVIVEDKVWDLTGFAVDHPGGAHLVQEQAGKDGTTPFVDAHSTDIIQLTLGGAAGVKKALMGVIDRSTVPAMRASGKADHGAPAEADDDADEWEVPPVEAILNVHDLVAIAERKLVKEGKKQAWDYYSSGAAATLTHCQENELAFKRIWMRPRVLVDVKTVDLTSKILGATVGAPLCGAQAAGVTAVCVTVDSAVAGPRERDQRNKIAMLLKQQAQQESAAKGAKALKPGAHANRDPALNWKDVAWFCSNTTIPIVLKGVQCGETLLAAKAGALPEIISMLTEAGLRSKLEVWLDGGIRRGSDVVKALALGANACGIGKPAMYGMSCYGAAGITKCVEILKREMVQTMQLCGTPRFDLLSPSLVDIRSLSNHSAPPAGAVAVTMPPPHIAKILGEEEWEVPPVEAILNVHDPAVAGLRERDQRNKIAMLLKQQAQQESAAKGAKARKPGCGEDAVLAAKAGVAAILVSNHGAAIWTRARSPIEALPEIISMLTEAGLRSKLEVWLDGGIRRGSDVVSALALGANACGIGKPAMALWAKETADVYAAIEKGHAASAATLIALFLSAYVIYRVYPLLPMHFGVHIATMALGAFGLPTLAPTSADAAPLLVRALARSLNAGVTPAAL